jgi:type I restriction enzyme S subunit
MVNMGEIFAHSRLGDIQMDRVPLAEKEAEKYLLKAGDLLFARQSLVLSGAGKCSIFVGASEPITWEGHLIRARLNSNIAYSPFYYYFFNSPQGRQTIESIVEQVAAAGIRGSDLAKLQVPLLSLSEQKEIAHILGTLDDKIELNQQMNQTLEGIARALFKSWFIDFDPVRAKLDGRQPAGMDAETAALFSDSFKDSPLGKIPRGWRAVPLPEVIEVNPRRSLSKGKIAPYLDMKNMPTQGHRPDSWVYRQFGSGAKFIQGDTLLARITPCLENGKTAFVDFLPEGEVGWGSTEYIVLRPKPPLPVEFGYFLARSDELRTHSISNMTGSSGRQRVPAVTQKFGEAVVPLMDQIRSNSEQNISLVSIRDDLLPKLLSGKIRVKDTAQVLEAVA